MILWYVVINNPGRINECLSMPFSFNFYYAYLLNQKKNIPFYNFFYLRSNNVIQIQNCKNSIFNCKNFIIICNYYIKKIILNYHNLLV